MIKDDIQVLFEYDRWANNRVLQATSTLSDEQFTRDLCARRRRRMGLAYVLESHVTWPRVSSGLTEAARGPIPSECVSQFGDGTVEAGGN